MELAYLSKGKFLRVPLGTGWIEIKALPLGIRKYDIPVGVVDLCCRDEIDVAVGVIKHIPDDHELAICGGLLLEGEISSCIICKREMQVPRKGVSLAAVQASDIARRNDVDIAHVLSVAYDRSSATAVGIVLVSDGTVGGAKGRECLFCGGQGVSLLSCSQSAHEKQAENRNAEC